MVEEKDEKPPKGGRWWVTLLVCVALAVGGWVIIKVIDSTEPEAERTQAAKRTAMLVQVIPAEKGNFQPRIEALGEVTASREVSVGARVSGEIVERSDAFVEGGIVKQGDLLVRIDPLDYQKILAQRQSEYQQAQAELELEKGQRNIARLDLELLEETLEVEDKGLALREPQLKSAQAAVELAAVALDRARLDLQRTEVRVPFDAQVMERGVDLGAQVATGTEIGRLVGLDEYWVVATVPLAALRWISFEREEPLQAEIYDEVSWGSQQKRVGQVERLLGSLDTETRLARIVIVVGDPLGRESGEPGLILGSLLDVVILGETIENVVRLPRQYVRKNDTVWVNVDGKLSIRETDIVFRDKDFAYLASGLEEGEQVVTTSLASVTEGAALRTEAAKDSAGEEGDE
ncbi:MAG: efflux RND transporter periplasmic adaptor subunit [Verrucomicrobiota bacterium JB023]|nr:efflux RND transporter periplasmic adaptor subunit [Verrucomicrobiota bacterium JB023]